MAALFPAGSEEPVGTLFPSADLQTTHQGMTRHVHSRKAFSSALSYPSSHTPPPSPVSPPPAADKGSSGDQSWLQNPSYAPPSSPDYHVYTSDSSGSDSYPEPKKKTKTARPPPTKGTEAKDSGEKDLFRVDCQADFENLHYGSVYSGSVSVYRRKFDCLGLRPDQKLKWDDGRTKVRRRRRRRVETDVRYFSEGLKTTPSELTIPRVARNTSTLSDFINIQVHLAASDGGSSQQHTAEQHMSQLTGEYNRSLLEQPHNVDLWLEFLAFQDQLLEWGQLPGDASNKLGHKNRALLNRKVSILERALEQNPTSEELLISHMALVRETWTTEEMVKKWKNIVFVQPNKPRLWLSYIQFCQTNFSSFSVSSLVSLYRKCINTLSSILCGTLKSHLPVPDTASYLMAIFSLYCSFLHQVGLTERAVALYQALVEFNLCAPSELGKDDRSLRQFFETFWDSGCPRVGEAGALGWAGWMKKTTDELADVKPLGVVSHVTVSKPEVKDVMTEEEEGEDADVRLVAGLSQTEAWLKLEEQRMVDNCFQWQQDTSTDPSEEDCTDPDRMVAFDDISHTLFQITEAELKWKLVLAFLSFLGAPVQPPFQSLLDVTSGLQSVHDVSPQSVLGSAGREETLQFGLGHTFSFLSATSLMGFAEAYSDQLLSDSTFTKLPSRTPAVQRFISTTCNHSLSLLPSPEHQTEVARVWLTFLFQQLARTAHEDSASKKDLKMEIRSIEKLFKCLLRLEQHRNDLKLWDCYAQFQYLVGNFKEARSLYQSILSQYPLPDAPLCCSLCECFLGLRRSLWGEVETGTHLCLHALTCLAEGKNTSPEGPTSVSPGRVLRARSHFALDTTCSGDSHVMACCHAYFEYLTRGMKEACEVFDKSVDRLQSVRHQEGDGGKEAVATTLDALRQVYLKKLWLLEHHSQLHPLQASLLRGAVEGALQVFPEDGRLMAIFVRSERQTFISGRMRRHFDHASPSARSPLPWVYALAAELDRYQRVTGRRLGDVAGVEETSVGTMHRVRSLLSRAVSAENARHCPLLWRLYMAVQVGLYLVLSHLSITPPPPLSLSLSLDVL